MFIDDMGLIPDPTLAIAAVVYRRGQSVNAVLESFARDLQAEGAMVRGLVQRRAEASRRCAGDIFLVDLEDGASFRISQALGCESESCPLDPAAVVEAGGVLRSALARGADLMIVNKFGKLEYRGGGLTHEMLSTAAAGIPVLTTLREDFLGRWTEVTGGAATLLRPEREEMENWWRWAKCPGRRLKAVENA